MFDFCCPECGKRQLIFPSQIKHLVNDDHGIAIIFACWCGALGTIRTGNAAEPGPDSKQEHVLAS